MATIYKEIAIKASPEKAWLAVRDVGAPHRLFTGVAVAAEFDGAAREVTFANGTRIRELIVDVNDDLKRIAYAWVGGSATHHNASIQVFQDGQFCRIAWITDVLPKEVAAAISPLVDAGAAAMKKTLET